MTKIPKRIHQIWIQGSESLSKIQNEFRQSWIDKNTDWKYRLWSLEDLDDILSHNQVSNLSVTTKAIKTAIMKINAYAGKADIMRYLIMYLYGGVYLDVDTKCKTSLSKLLKEEDEVVSGLGARKDLHQWVLVYYQFHPIMKKTLETAVTNVLKEIWTNSHPVMKRKMAGLTGPPVLHYCATQCFGLPKTYKFKPGVHVYNGLKLRVLNGNHFGNNIILKDFTRNTSTHWGKVKLFVDI